MRSIACTVATVVATLGMAAPGSAQPPQTNGPPRPPPQAYAYCAGHKAGDSVQITPPGRAPVEATCAVSTQGLFARPEHPPVGPGPGGRPPGMPGNGGNAMPPPSGGHGSN